MEQDIAPASSGTSQIVVDTGLVRRVLGIVAAVCGLSLQATEGAPSMGAALPPQSVLAQINNLLPQRPGIVDAYAIVVGGDGGEDVFEREVNTVRQRLQEQLGASGRIITLVNSRRSPQPEATLSSLLYVIQRISERMDREEDLLFVHLASHGSADHQFVLSHPSEDLYWLGPKYLSSVLKKSGIRHRVVVVSACYSGGFVHDLADENTMVLTASAGTVKSYGCGNASQITDFSRAFYTQAWTGSHTLIQAAKAVAQYVYEDESRARRDHSYPQLWIGANMDAYLRQLESTLPQSRK
jgi:hypothetical protein